MKLVRSLSLVPYAAVLLVLGTARLQAEGPEDAAIDQIRRLSNIIAVDQDSIRNWIQIQVDELAGAPPGVGGLNGDAFKAFRKRFSDQYSNRSNTAEFRVQFATQTAAVASAEFAKANLKPTVAWGLAQALVDMPRQPETIPGLLAGLDAGAPVARYLCAEGLAAQRAAITGDPNRLPVAIQALRTAALSETSAPALGRMYEALAFPGQPGLVLDAYLAVFDRRLEQRRLAPGDVDGAEIAAFEFLRSDRVLAALDANQKAEVARRIAVFLRLDAERYNDPMIAPPSDASAPDLMSRERAVLERRIEAEEEILEQIVGDKGGKIRDTFANGGYELHAEVLRQAYRWIGNVQSNEPGALNEAPWNVELGAP